MKYFLLAQWVKENRKTGLTVEKILLTESCLIVAFKNGVSLSLYYKTSNPFPWFAKDNKFEGVLLWQQMHNSELTDIQISETDRIIYFDFSYKDIYQKQVEQVFAFECMPPLGNVILCRKDSGKLIIHDALNKYTYADNPQRQVLSGLLYETPHTGFIASAEAVNYPLEISPADETDTVLCNTMNEYFHQYFELIIQRKETARKKQMLLSHWNKELAKVQKKLAAQLEELKDAEKEKTWLIWSETIKVNLPNIQKGDAVLSAVNYYDPDLQTVEVPLKPELSPKDNLKYYLKKYTKARQGREKIGLQLVKTRQDIEQIKSILALFETDKWQELGSGTDKPSDAIKSLKQADSLFRIPVNEDWEIIIGRKAKENDLISTQIGKPADWWFHTRIYHGSHVLLRNYHKKEPPSLLVELCCSLAAWFSKARHSGNVPVDYTQLRYVRKPRKSAPGFVTYTNQKTVFADPVDVNGAKEILSRYGG